MYIHRFIFRYHLKLSWDFPWCVFLHCKYYKYVQKKYKIHDCVSFILRTLASKLIYIKDLHVAILSILVCRLTLQAAKYMTVLKFKSWAWLWY